MQIRRSMQVRGVYSEIRIRRQNSRPNERWKKEIPVWENKHFKNLKIVTTDLIPFEKGQLIEISLPLWENKIRPMSSIDSINDSIIEM